MTWWAGAPPGAFSDDVTTDAAVMKAKSRVINSANLQMATLARRPRAIHKYHWFHAYLEETL
jgi:hypothetical protein